MDMDTIWQINEHGYFEAPGLSALVFHNEYPEGKQGGVEIIQHGERILSCGDVRVRVTPGQWDVRPKTGERTVERTGGMDETAPTISVPGHFEEIELAYTVHVRPQGHTLRISVELAAPLPAAAEGRVGFNLEIYPQAYMSKSFKLDGAQYIDAVNEVFPHQANGPKLAEAKDYLAPAPLASGTQLVAAPEDPLRRFEILSETGNLALYDGRETAQNGWFVLRELIPAGVKGEVIVWLVTPNMVPGWRRDPVICVSQVGYHPNQVKHAILELDPRSATVEEAKLQRIEGPGLIDVLSKELSPWGRFLRYDYAIFDFTEVREPGLYQIRYADQVAGPFQIHPEVYQYNVWQPTLETFFPVQMCHVAVKDRYHTWHGACHLDDALQAPAPHEHFDGYRQYAETETDYEPYEHIPYLDRGGWHDAGDYDLAAGSQARTTHTLALVRELFGIDSDQTTVPVGNQDEGLVLIHTPDGVPDILEQVAHGVENLLGGYRAAGHSFQGIIANSLEQYVHLGDASTMTDNRVYDPGLALEERADDLEAPLSGELDDRWAFTNHDTALEYLVAAALAAASRVLKDAMPALATECQTTAVQIWDYEQSHEPVEQRGAYVPRDREAQEVLAAVELLLATGDGRYRQRVLDLRPVIEAHVMRIGGAVARALPAIGDESLTEAMSKALSDAIPDFEEELRTNPFGVHFRPHIWGIGWQLLGIAVQLYQLWLAFPELVDREMLLRVVNYNLGCHPASSTSLVSGVGTKSATVAYGVNRMDWSYIPGGVISGPALIRPDFMELKEPWPYLWQQTEYVMSGAANYIFCILAADRMLNNP